MRIGRALASNLLPILAATMWAALPAAAADARTDSSEAGSSYSFTLATPDPQWSPSADGFVELRIEGFRTLERRIGAPDVPWRTVLVAIPPGATPRLEARRGAEDLRPGLRPRPVPKRVADTSGPEPGGDTPTEERRVYAPDPALYRVRASHPLAWLGAIGTLRDQRYVELHLAPVRYDAAAEGLSITRSLEVTVHFDGDSGARAEPVREPRFEEVYRKAFVNYTQGRSFRLGALAASGGSGATAVTDAPAPSTVGPEGSGATPRRRIRIRANGAVVLDHAALSATGFTTVPLANWKLTNRGQNVPVQVNDENMDGFLGAGEWIRFYGQALDDEPDPVLNSDLSGNEDLYEIRDFTDENVYFLTVVSGAQVTMTQRNAAPNFVLTPPDHFEEVVHQEVDDMFRPAGPVDPWYWNPALSLGAPSRTDLVPLKNLYSGTLPARVRVQLKGLSESGSVDPDHLTRVSLNDSGGQVLDTDDGAFDGRVVHLHDFVHSPGLPVTDPVQVKVELLSVPVSINDVALDWIELLYRRGFSAANDSLTFSWPNGNAEFRITGFTSASPEVYEITGRVAGSGVVAPVRLTGVLVTPEPGPPYTVRFRMDNDTNLPGGALRRFVVVGASALAAPSGADFQPDLVSDLRLTSNQADLIVIAHPGVLDAGAGSPLSQLLGLRASQGISSKIALLEDVQDEFNEGLSGPLAIKSFLSWVLGPTGWATPKPAFVLLLGDASYDYKAGTANGSYVPTQIVVKDNAIRGDYPSDNLLANVVGTDQLADLVVGRISARTVAEANVVLQKVRDYETLTPAGDWRGHALFVSDRGKQYSFFEALEFEFINDIGADKVNAPHTLRKLRYWTDNCCQGQPNDQNCVPNCNPALMEAEIKAAVLGNDGFDGTSVMQFSGHGNFDLWSDDVILCGNPASPFCGGTDDTQALNNGLRLPWLIVHNCLTGGFHSAIFDKSMGEQWLKKSGGGAVAVTAVSGLGFQFIGEAVTETIYEDLFGPRKERDLAVPVMDNLVGLCTQGSIEACQYYVLLGDPSMRLALPQVDPPSGALGTGANARVNLSWTASPNGTAYDFYRALNPAGPYVKVNVSPISEATACSGTSCVHSDLTAQNATTYYYSIVARDAALFESRWSNFNEECPGGPDCVRATPLNPNPPAAPASINVVDSESGGRLQVSWTPHPELNDLAHYTLHRGTQAGVYTTSFNVSKTITGLGVTGLVNGTTYYFALTATNTSGLTSGFSPEDSEYPTLVQGVRAPRVITDLRLAKSGNDIELSWSAMTQNIYGRPLVTHHYDIHRSTSVTFVPSPANRVQQTAGLSYIDANALLPGGPNYYYLVVAVDASGVRGGAGRQLPAGIIGMVEARSTGTPGNVVLSWPLVTTDFDGRPTLIDHYEIYARDQIFTRAAIEAGTITPVMSVPGPPVEPPASAANQYYSVLAVDVRGNKSPF